MPFLSQSKTSRASVKADIVDIQKLIDEKIAEIGNLKDQLHKLQLDSKPAELASLRKDVETAQEERNSFLRKPIPVIPPQPSPDPILGEFNSMEEAQPIFIAKIACHFPSLKEELTNNFRNHPSPDIVEYLKKKTEYNIANEEKARYDRENNSTAQKLNEARKARDACEEKMQQTSKNILNLQLNIEKLARVTGALVKVTTMLRNGLIDKRAEVLTHIYSHAQQVLLIYQEEIPTDVTQMAINRKRALQEEYQGLVTIYQQQQNKWRFKALDNVSLIPALAVLGFALYYCDKDNISSGKIVGLLLILFCACRFSQIVADKYTRFENAVADIGEIIKRIELQISEFLERVNNTTDLACRNAREFMLEMQIQAERLVTQTDESLARATEQFSLFSHSFVAIGENVRLGLQQAGEEHRRGIEHAGDSIARKIPSCKIL